MSDLPAAAPAPDADDPPPLKIRCTDSKCDDNLHCFRATAAMKKTNQQGACRECGAQLVDWPRVHSRDLSDIDNTFAHLRREMIRHHFWHVDIDQGARDHATRKGRVELRHAARRRLEKSVGRSGNAWDGRQTGFSGNTIFYAQHATASCCRTCIAYWHDIPADRNLAPDELDYLHALVIRYLDERLPDLADGPQRVPRRRRR